LVKADDSSLRPLTPDDVPLNAAPTSAWAMAPADKTVRRASRLNALLLLRFPPSRLTARSQSRAADGVVAYTAICTHSGCEVSDWIADQETLSCPCHDSLFDPKDDARVVDGPAPRSGRPRLPRLRRRSRPGSSCARRTAVSATAPTRKATAGWRPKGRIPRTSPTTSGIADRATARSTR